MYVCVLERRADRVVTNGGKITKHRADYFGSKVDHENSAVQPQNTVFPLTESQSMFYDIHMDDLMPPDIPEVSTWWDLPVSSSPKSWCVCVCVCAELRIIFVLQSASSFNIKSRLLLHIHTLWG